ncbi:hypothetical protein Stuart_28 [Providencia phage vB_PstP_PS3]|uniref:Uncharacterized protein n=1 Tax=Providencia phage vB_PstP_PS3 TaxID=2848038 RepID=A0A411AWG4_9CAUD|nr:hypothetical protein HOV05_gp28 [Providencia phage vB_PstP_PS3]QAX92429.1 hypothetical protein Stuart_28 [Providencia phage vB_PstP_PS3]
MGSTEQLISWLTNVSQIPNYHCAMLGTECPNDVECPECVFNSVESIQTTVKTLLKGE